MPNTPLLNIPQVAPSQNQKEATINTGLAILEAACNDVADLSLVGGNRVLTTDEFTKNFHLVFDSQTAARQVTIPATARFFAVSNNGAYGVTIHCTGSTGLDLLVPAGSRVLVVSNGADVAAISAGVSLLADLSDATGAGAASQGQVLAYDATGETWGPVDNPSDHEFFHLGAPTASQKVYRHAFVRSVRLSSDFSGSQAIADVAATASTVFQVLKNATVVGSITFAIGGTAGTFSTDVGSGSTSVSFAPGDILTVVAPASPDATLADIAATLKGAIQ